MDVLWTVLWLAEVFSLAYIAYRCLLGILSLRYRQSPPAGKQATRFLIVIPAHNEELYIAATVRHLQMLDYPAGLRHIVVVADACSDGTAAAAEQAGAQVLVKPAPATTKGATIRWTLSHAAITETAWDALVIFDADSRPGTGFLAAMDGALARGDKAIQGRCESHGQAGWVPTAYAVNTTQRNRTWHLARELAGFSAALTGTGICFARDVLSKLPVETKTLTEDLEYTARLTLLGVRARYLHEAVTIIEQPATLRASTGQRLRWARGQISTSLAYGPALAWRGITKLDISALDTALYLFLPSLVPFQALLGVFVLVSLLAGESVPQPALGLPATGIIPVIILLCVSLVLPYLGLRAEGRPYALRDWIAFLLLMLSWLPIALYGALTLRVRVWYRTPRQAEESLSEAEAPREVDPKRGGTG